MIKKQAEKLRALKPAHILLAALLVCVGACLLLSGAQQDEGALEARVQQMLENVSGVGKARVTLHTQKTPQGYGEQARESVVGAVIVAQGAEDIAVRINIISAVQTLLSLPPSAIEVFEMEVAP